MTFNIDTQTIRRLRDALIENGRLGSDVPDSGQANDDRQQTAINRVAPFVETMYLVMIADGHEADTEKEVILGALSMLTHGFLDSTALDSIVEHSAKATENQGVEQRLQTIGAQISAQRQDRETAFTLAAAVALADEQLDHREDSLIESIAEWYGVSTKRCNEILQQLEHKE